MEIRNLMTFLRVAELQNFTRAAEQLGYSQSTVTDIFLPILSNNLTFNSCSNCCICTVTVD